jgi:hypothetical protein
MSGYKVNFSATDAGFSGTVSRIKSSLNSMDDNVRKVERNMSTSFSSMAKAGAVFAAGFGAVKLAFGAVSGAADGLFTSIQKASDMGETVSKTNVIFQENAKEIQTWASTAATSLGQSKQQAMDAAAGFATFGKSAGLSGQELVKFSTDLTGLAADVASFNNASPEEVILAIGSALRGEAEPMRRFGVLLDDASLRAQALKMGIIETTKDALTPQQKVLAAQALIMEQTSTAQGDFARTSEGLANQQRILAAQISDASASLGQMFLPIVTEVVSALNQEGIPALMNFINAGQSLDTADFAKDIGQRLREAFQLISSGDIWELFKLNAEKAIMGLQTSPAMNDFNASLNAIWDGITSKAGEGFDFSKSFERYKSAGVQANDELALEIDRKLTELNERQSKRAAESAAKFAEDAATKSANRAADEISAKLKKEEERTKGMVDQIDQMLKDLDKPTEEIKDTTVAIKENLREGSDAMVVAAEAIKESLSLSEQIVNRINEAEAKSRIDRGGKLEGRINDAINSGDFRKARREADKLREAEDEQKIRDFFTDDPFAKTTSKIKMSLKDLARKEGVETFGKTPDEIRDALLDKMREREKGMDAKQRGKTKEEAARDANKGQPAADPMKVIVSTVEQIKQLLAKIEPKLPTPALGA